MDRREILELKSRVDILKLLEEIGAKVTLPDAWEEEVFVFCPFCSDLNSSNPAGRANFMKGLYFCYSCGFGGDAITIARRHLTHESRRADIFGEYEATFDQAVKYLEEMFPEDEEGDDDPWAD